jgi:hypothetical protein
MYLGLPIMLGRLRIVHLQPVLDRNTSKLARWQGWLLNLGGGGEHELVRPVLSSLPTYLQIAIKPSKKFYKDLDKIRHRFLWVGNQ